MAGPIYVNLQEGISLETAVKLVKVVADALQKGHTELHLLMSSQGGLIDPGMAIFNFLRGTPLKVTTYNYGYVDSVSGVIYCAGTKRLATPHCKFLIHGITWRIPANTNVTELREQQIREFLGQVDAMKHNIGSVIAEATGKTVDAVSADMTKGVTLTATEAKAYGLVHDISTTLVPAGVQIVSL
jgi:ATP-dependent Clp protease protease subunit